jgi:YebC/PmpR family DNA-binding regulatory protein
MSGHSKWKTIKHQKGAADAKRGQLFTRLTREISLAARQGAGGDPEMNYPLRLAIDRARANNMPSDTIERAIKRGSGEGADQVQLEEITYEGYGPGGVAILLQAVTDNRNRTASEVRATFSKSGASLGASGCVAWNFETMGLITMEMTPEDAEDMALLAIDAGAEDVRVDDSYVEVFTLPEKLEAVKRQLEEENASIATAEVSMVPKATVALGPKEAERTLRLLDMLEDLQDAQKVYTNADFPEETLEKYRSEA